MCYQQIYNLPDCLFALINGSFTTKPSAVHHLLQFSANSLHLPPRSVLVASSTQNKDPLMKRIDAVTLKHAAPICSIRVKDVSVGLLKPF